jgi:D-alanyl-D-alanine carboxypeptidase
LVACAALAAAGCAASPEGERVPEREQQAETPRVHPMFDIPLDELLALVADKPEDTRASVRERPQVFLEYVDLMLALPDPALALVDKTNTLGAAYVPDDLVQLDRYADRLAITRDGLALSALIIPDLLAMGEAAAQRGIRLDVSSTYRSYEYQEGLFAYWVDELGREEAERVSARAGTSQHQLGTTIDFGSVTREFANTDAGRWLAEHAWRFGFSLSYPDGYESVTGYAYEPWHFRWISRPASRMEREFFGGVQQHMLEFWTDHREWFTARRRDEAE